MSLMCSIWGSAILDTAPTITHHNRGDGTLGGSLALCTFTGSPGQMVVEMMCASGGQDPFEIVLDGLAPSPDGPWSVYINEKPRRSETLSAATVSPPEPWCSWWTTSSPESHYNHPTTASNCSSLATSQLRSLLWGSNSSPADVLGSAAASRCNRTASPTIDENLLHRLAARCSIPIG